MITKVYTHLDHNLIVKMVMNEIKDEDDDNLVFIDSNKEEFSFNTLRKLLNFISAIYNGEITLKEADISHRNLEEK